jgi:DNA replication licensing factor MCM3
LLICSLLNNAFEELVAFQRALKDFVASIDATYAKQYEEFYVGLEGSFGSKHVSPRTLTSCFLSCVVCVEGIVTKCEWVKGGTRTWWWDRLRGVGKAVEA